MVNHKITEADAIEEATKNNEKRVNQSQVSCLAVDVFLVVFPTYPTVLCQNGRHVFKKSGTSLTLEQKAVPNIIDDEYIFPTLKSNGGFSIFPSDNNKE